MIRGPRWDVRELDSPSYSPNDQSWTAFARRSRAEHAGRVGQLSATRVSLLLGYPYQSPTPSGKRRTN